MPRRKAKPRATPARIPPDNAPLGCARCAFSGVIEANDFEPCPCPLGQLLERMRHHYAALRKRINT